MVLSGTGSPLLRLSAKGCWGHKGKEPNCVSVGYDMKVCHVATSSDSSVSEAYQCVIFTSTF